MSEKIEIDPNQNFNLSVRGADLPIVLNAISNGGIHAAVAPLLDMFNQQIREQIPKPEVK